MFRAMLVGIFVCLTTLSRADYASDFRDKVKSLDERYVELDKRANNLLAGDADFAKYAEIRNEIIRFIGEPRRELSQSRTVAEQQAGDRLQTEQELKVLLSNLNFDVTDDDNKAVALSALQPRIEDAIIQSKKQLEDDQKALADVLNDQRAKRAKQRDPATSPDDKRALGTELSNLAQEISKARGEVVTQRLKVEQLTKAKELLARTIDISNFSQKFRPEVERLESLESRASQKIQQIDEAIFNFLLIESNDKRYTLYATLVFGVAVVIVIGSFFFVAYKSEAIRASIFGNDSGLQFVTLFSLVIAIILFGVLKILGGKELAALLGGLSGYILGRGGISRQVASSPGAPPPAANPPAA